MLFRVCEHYDDNQVNYEKSIIYHKECFICFDIITINEVKCNTLNNQSLCIKNCTCDGAVHKKCLKIWVDLHKSCPICRKKVSEINTVSIILYNYIPFGNYIYVKIRKISYSIIRFMIVLLISYNIVDFYLRVFKRSRIYEDYTYYSDIDYSYYPYSPYNESNKN